MTLQAGAAVCDITPRKSLFLVGYPNVERDSTGVHDPLSASALCLLCGGEMLLIVAVDVLNIAGRPVATVRRDSATLPGLQRVLWSGQSDRGTQAPDGTYLVRIAARDDDGQQAQSLCSLRLRW